MGDKVSKCLSPGSQHNKARALLQLSEGVENCASQSFDKQPIEGGIIIEKRQGKARSNICGEFTCTLYHRPHNLER